MTALLHSKEHALRSYALTAGHVLGAGGAGALNDSIAMIGIGSPLLGRNSDFLPSFHSPGEASAIDAGLVRLETEQLQTLLRGGFELPQGQAGLYTGGQVLSLRAQPAPRPAASVEEITCLMEPGTGGAAGSYQIVRGMLYQCAGGTEGGHSGAALWNERQELVGMHLGSAPTGSGGNAVAMPIGRVFSAWPSLSLIDELNADRMGAPDLVPHAASSPVSTPVTQPAFREVEVLARTLWGEARGEPQAGIEAVACVVLNRVRRQSYWGRSIAEVCLKPYQFSCWNQDDPNRRQLLSLSSSDPQYRRALEVAKAAVAGDLIDATQGATHYYSKRLRRPPVWALGHSACADIGLHLFFNKIR
nr:cell wall hydrolase [Paucibacter sp. M5-1]MCZ7881974.1 cell wall hydrolase [Paucibacter sp. M5-1]